MIDLNELERLVGTVATAEKSPGTLVTDLCILDLDLRIFMGKNAPSILAELKAGRECFKVLAALVKYKGINPKMETLVIEADEALTAFKEVQ